MFKMGVIDPLKVTKNALINATGVATTILSTNAIVTHGGLSIIVVICLIGIVVGMYVASQIDNNSELKNLNKFDQP